MLRARPGELRYKTAMRWMIALAVLAACSKDKTEDSPSSSTGDPIDEAKVDFARKEVPEIDKKLASDDPGAASSSCAVIKPDLAVIRKADPKLAETIERRCGRDLAIRQLAVFVARAEAERAKDPTGMVMECSSLDIYLKPVRNAGVEADAEVTALVERHGKACPKK